MSVAEIEATELALDAPTGGLWRAIEPIAEALENDNPDIVIASRAYREPVCFDTEFNVQRRR